MVECRERDRRIEKRESREDKRTLPFRHIIDTLQYHHNGRGGGRLRCSHLQREPTQKGRGSDCCGGERRQEKEEIVRCFFDVFNSGGCSE
jgi:hypothetical protein